MFPSRYGSFTVLTVTNFNSFKNILSKKKNQDKPFFGPKRDREYEKRDSATIRFTV